MRRWMAISLFAIAMQSSAPRESWGQVAPFIQRRYPDLLELMRDGDTPQNTPTSATSPSFSAREFPVPPRTTSNTSSALHSSPSFEPPITSNQGRQEQGSISRSGSDILPANFSVPVTEVSGDSRSVPLQAPSLDGPDLLVPPTATEAGNRKVAYSELQVINVQMPIPPSPPQTPNLAPPADWQSASFESDTIAPPPATMLPESASLVPAPEPACIIPPAPTHEDTVNHTAPFVEMPYSDGGDSTVVHGDVLYEEPPFDCYDCVDDGVSYRNLFPAEIFQEPDPLGQFLPFGNFGVKPGNDRVITGGGFFIPLWQSPDSLFFTELRGNVDDRDSGDGYIGLGYRTYMDPYWIFGISIYADLIGTNQDNFFAQGQLSIELMSVNWEFRVNGYGPESTTAGTITQSGISNGTVVTRDFRERAYSGLEAEIGHRFLNWGYNDKYEVRWFLGGYSFGEDSGTFPTFAGPRGRLEMRIFDLPWCGQQSRLEIGAELSYDRIRDEQFFGYFRIRIPFGPKDGRPALDPLRRRMVDTPVHRVD